ncbi:hypothetical protein CTEN210_08889 [Chaetoceros tenuissimus]|uniref:Uncharacterized protein n=1 Tax=Chaetoceros tenuissimus TaxID=426638 RepID=A0AAD3H730_9STRA|nr:hypothetical protein CTEN210_08889 [Chaetoceros tenuissimus]
MSRDLDSHISSSMITKHHDVNIACPDLRFGYTPDDIYTWMDMIGPKGRDLYQRMVHWDLFPYMESYTLLLATILWRQCQSSTKKNLSLLAYLPFLVMFCDVIETAINGYALVSFPSRVDDKLMYLSSMGNQLKWITFLAAILSIGYIEITKRQKISSSKSIKEL